MPSLEGLTDVTYLVSDLLLTLSIPSELVHIGSLYKLVLADCFLCLLYLAGLLNGSKENLCVPSAKQGPRKKKSQSVEKLLKSEGKWKKKNYFWRQATRSRCTVLFRLVAPHPS